MIVVADTSSLNYLIQIDLIVLLPQLYGIIIVPPGVLEELSDRRAPAIAVPQLPYLGATKAKWLFAQERATFDNG